MLSTPSTNGNNLLKVDNFKGDMKEEDQPVFSDTKKFSIIIPAYNEENRIKPVLEEICTYIDLNNLPWDVIIAVDGNDRTEDIINSYNKKYPFVNLNKSSDRSGMGGAIKRGILASTAEYLILMDSDSSSSLLSIIRSIELLDKYDIVNFDRYSDPENKIPLRRRFPSRSLNLMLKLVYRINISDTQCGYKIMRRDAVVPLVKRITISNAFFLSAMFIYAKDYGVSVVEIPIKYSHSYGSKFNVVMTSISYIVSIVAFKVRDTMLYDYTPKFIKRLYYRKLRYL